MCLLLFVRGSHGGWWSLLSPSGWQNVALTGGLACAVSAFLNTRYLAPSKAVDAPDCVKVFVRETLAGFGVPNAKDIIVKVSPSIKGEIDAEGKNIITLSSFHGKVLADLFARKSEGAPFDSDEDTLNMYRGILAHEASHLKRHDTLRIPVVLVLTDLITYGLFKAAQLSPWAESAPLSFFTSHPLVFMYFSHLLAQIFYTRSVEQIADDAVPNDRRLLNALGKFFKSNCDFAMFFLGNKKWRFRMTAFLVDPFHPSMDSRAEKLLARAEMAPA